MICSFDFPQCGGVGVEEAAGRLIRSFQPQRQFDLGVASATPRVTASS